MLARVLNVANDRPPAPPRQRSGSHIFENALDSGDAMFYRYGRMMHWIIYIIYKSICCVFQWHYYEY